MDLLDAFRLGDNPAVTTASGFCETREGQKKPDVAYKLTKKAVISIPTATVFPGKLVKMFFSSGSNDEFHFRWISL